MSPAAPRWSHAALNCADLERTEAFYTTHLGFRRVRTVPLEGSQIVFLRSGEVLLELFEVDGAPARAAGDGPATPGTVRHLAFQVDSVEEVLGSLPDSVPRTLGPLDFDAFIPGWRTVWVSDPDGVVVEISQGYADEDQPPTTPHNGGTP